MRERDFLAVSEATSLDELRVALVAVANKLDFGLVNLALMVGAVDDAEMRCKSVGNTPEAFMHQAMDPSWAALDPVNHRLMRQGTPFFYDADMYAKAGAGDLWDTQAQHGYRFGVATALHLPRNERVLLGIDRDIPLPTDERRRVRLLAELQLLAVHAREAAETLLQAGPVTPARGPGLTEFELEVLRWTMHGKSAPVTGQIIGKSAATVNYHLQSAMRKLNVGSKHQAVTLALALGVL